MRVSGVGSEHDVAAHQVTNCIHDHSAGKKKSGGAMAQESSVLKQEAEEVKQEQGFSLSDWLRNALGNGKRILQGIWGSSAEGTAGTTESAIPGTADVRTIPADAQNPAQTAAAATAVKDGSIVQNNPYFSAIQDTGRKQETLWEKVKVRFQSVAGQLSNRFAGKDTFSPKQEQPKEDLSRHSRFRQEDVEVECVLTDDSYLLDSYDKKGEYSKLTTKK